jgi:Xaa-Pro aminopeptidase
MPTGSTRAADISAAEYAERQACARRLAADRGWPGIAVLGRGGGTHDRHGDLWYLTGHYQAYPYLHDRPPLWSGRSHALLVLPVDGPSVLICSAPEWEDALPVEEVRVSGDFGGLAREALRTVAGGGLVGADTAPTTLAGVLADAAMEADDELLEPLRRAKSAAELELIREACRIGSRAVDRFAAAAQPGASEGEAVAAALGDALADGAWPYICAVAAGDRDRSYTGRPSPGYRSEREFVAGETVRIDLVLVHRGYYCDFGRSFPVGGGVPAVCAAVDRLRAGLAAAVAAAVPGAAAGDVAAAGSAALGDAEQAYPPHWGHGLGLGWEGPWLLPDSREPLEANYTLAIEATISLGGATVSGEENVLVADPPEVLTDAGWAT